MMLAVYISSPIAIILVVMLIKYALLLDFSKKCILDIKNSVGEYSIFLSFFAFQQDSNKLGKID
jgi:hypothetical protein